MDFLSKNENQKNHLSVRDKQAKKPQKIAWCFKETDCATFVEGDLMELNRLFLFLSLKKKHVKAMIFLSFAKHKLDLFKGSFRQDEYFPDFQAVNFKAQ